LQEEAVRIREGVTPKSALKAPSAPLLEGMKSLKLSSQRSFDIIAMAVAPSKKKAHADGPRLSSTPLASHVLTFDDEDFD